MSYKLYYDDPYLTQFSATVTQCIKDNDNYLIVLDKTAFYPEGGGQPCDHGYFEASGTQIPVLHVKEKDDVIYHVVEKPVNEGRSVTGFIDFDRRFDHMQQHTGEHILSGIVNSMYGFNNVGFHMGEKEVLVDFDGVLSQEDIQAIMDACNQEVWANRPVIAIFPEDLSEITYRSKKELSGQVRIVKAGYADSCACCGTHTLATAACGPIAIIDFMAYKGGTRINMLCGKRAVDFYNQRNIDCHNLSRVLSAKLNDVPQSVEARLKDIETLKVELSDAELKLYTLWADMAVPENDILFTSKDNLTSAQIQSLCQLLAKKASTAFVISKQEDNVFKICFISTVLNPNEIGKKIADLYNGKGGGKPGIYQGFIEKELTKQNFLDIIL